MRISDQGTGGSNAHGRTSRSKRRSGERGVALLTSLMILMFLSLTGGALISSTRVDVQVASNYRTGVRSLFLAEAGIEAGRLILQNSPNVLTVDLTTAAGGDGVLDTSRDLDTLLASDDQPLLPANPAIRTVGRPIADTDGTAAGRVHVWLRNDVEEDLTLPGDNNRVVTLLSVARVGDATRTIETVVQRRSLPPLPAALTLDGPVADFDPANANPFRIDGWDTSGNGDHRHAIGVINDADDTLVSNEIPNPMTDNYTGLGGEEPNVENIDADLAPEYATVSGLEGLVDAMEALATTTFNPGFGVSQPIGNIGTAADPEIVFVNGDADFGPGTGHGILVVRGDFTLNGNFAWNGVILVIGQGTLLWNGGGNGAINGGILIAKTRGTRSPSDLIGPQLASRGDIDIDFQGGGGNYIQMDVNASLFSPEGLPYDPISITEY